VDKAYLLGTAHKAADYKNRGILKSFQPQEIKEIF
jgi:hypothetical protein